MKHTIYASVDPRDGDIRYIGRTAILLSQRLAAHLNAPTGAGTRAWFEELRAAGHRPVIQKLEEVEESAAIEREQAWIDHMERQGISLLNAGTSRSGRRKTEATRRVIVAMPLELDERIKAFAERPSRPRVTMNDAVLYLIQRGLETLD